MDSNSLSSTSGTLTCMSCQVKSSLYLVSGLGVWDQHLHLGNTPGFSGLSSLYKDVTSNPSKLEPLLNKTSFQLSRGQVIYRDSIHYKTG